MNNINSSLLKVKDVTIARLRGEKVLTAYLDGLQDVASHLDKILSAIDINRNADKTSRGLIGRGATNGGLVATSDNLTSEHSLVYIYYLILN